MTSALPDKEEREMVLRRSFEEVDRFRHGEGLGIACGRIAQAEEQRGLCLRACALPSVFWKCGDEARRRSVARHSDSCSPTPLVPYKCAELTAWLNGCPEAVPGLVTCCIPGACSPQALCGLVLGAWSY